MGGLPVATFSVRQLPLLLVGSGGRLEGERVKIQRENQQKRYCYANLSKSTQTIVKSQPSSMFSLSFSSCEPLYETPGAASFDDYIEDHERFFKATFPGQCKKLNQDEWRVEMAPVELLFLKAWPVIDIQFKYKSNSKDYPLHVPSSITKVLELDMTRFELKGLHSDYKQTDLDVKIRATLYSERKGSQSWLRHDVMMSVTSLGPQTLAFIPKDIIQGLLQQVLKKTIEDLSKQVHNNLQADYSKFKVEKLEESASFETLRNDQK